MRGDDRNQGSVFGYVSLEARVPPERLLRALLVQILFSIRSERQLMEQLEYNLLFRWFVGLGMDDPVWDPTTFGKNRDRLLESDVARAFFDAVLEQAAEKRLLSSDHFTVDGTLSRPGRVTRASSRRSGRRARRRSGVSGHAGGDHRVTLGADKGYDTQDFIDGCRGLNVTPHVAQNTSRRSSRIDGRTTRHEGYAVSQRRRKQIEEVFGWMKTVGLMRKVRHRGREKVDWMFVFTAAAYNLVRLRGMAAVPT